MSDPTRAVMCGFDLTTPGKGDVLWPTGTIEFPAKVSTLGTFEAPDTGIVYTFEGVADTGLGISGSGVGIFLGSASVPAQYVFGAVGLEIYNNASIFMTGSSIVQTGNGTAADPALCFFSDATLGLYRSADNQMGVACNGVNVATFTPTGLQLATVLAGAYGGTGVANTGKTITVSGNTTIGSSTHTVAFATGANTSVTLPATGTLATLAGTETLSNKTISIVAGTAGTPALNFGSSSSDSNTGLYWISADTIGVSSGGTNCATLSASTAAIVTSSGATTSSLELNPSGLTAGYARLVSQALAFRAPPTEGGNGILFQSNSGANQAQIYNISGSASYFDFDTILNIRSGYSGSTVLAINSTRAQFEMPVRLKGYTVATLPAGSTGDLAYVTDATAPTYNGALTGGGAVVVPVFYNGSAWVSH